MKIITIFLFFIFSFSYSQNTTTKFVLSGKLTDKPQITSKQTCEFKKRKQVEIIDFLDNDWWKVNYNGCIGYVTSPFIFITDDLIKFKEIRYQEIVRRRGSLMRRKDSLMRRKDSIKRVTGLINRRNDSILKINERRRKISIIRNIKAYAADSLLTATVNKGAHLKTSPSIFGNIEVTFEEKKKVIVLNYGDGYFKVCFNSKCGYISDLYFMTNSLLFDEIEDEFVAELKKIKVHEEYEKKYGEDIAYKLKHGRYWIGMTKEMAHISLGSPDNINKSTGSWGVHEQWVYSDKGIYLYFENGKLNSYQN